MEFKIDTDKIINEIVSEALEKEMEGKTLKQWIEEIKKRVWVSVKDRLPEKTESYLCLCYDPETKEHWHSVLWYEKNYNHWWDDLMTLECNYTKYVVYWMALPEPPKEGKDAEK